MRRAVATVLRAWMLTEKHAPAAMRDVPGTSYATMPVALFIQLLTVVAPADAKMTARSGQVATLATDSLLRLHRTWHDH